MFLLGVHASKVLLTPSDVLAHAQNLPGVASVLTGDRVDVEATLARRENFTHGLDDSSQVEWAEGTGIAIIRGHARLSGEREVAVGDRTVRARRAVVLATGPTANIAPIDGLDVALPSTSRDATNVHEVPQRLAIIGGGVVTCEAATWFAAFGTEVTLLVRGDPSCRTSQNSPRPQSLTAALDRGHSASEYVPDLGHPGHAERHRIWPDTRRSGQHQEHAGRRRSSPPGSRRGPRRDWARPGIDDLGLDTVGLGDLSSSHGFVTVDDSMRVLGVEGNCHTGISLCASTTFGPSRMDRSKRSRG